jgi:uncharacterized protein (TIGR02246 family)
MDKDRDMDTPMERAAGELAARWAQAWNRHDMSTLGELVTEDADWVTVAGVRLQGRAQIEQTHERLHRAALAHSTWTNLGLSVAPVADGLGLVHLSWSIQGDRDAQGVERAPRHGIFSWLLVDTKGRWKIRAAHGTNVVAPAA